MDGAGLLLTLRSVVAPIVLPGIAATSLICFIFSWNELLLARTLTGTVAGTAPVYLTGFVTSQGLFLAQVCRSEEHTSELQSRQYLVCRLLLEKKTEPIPTQNPTRPTSAASPHRPTSPPPAFLTLTPMYLLPRTS